MTTVELIMEAAKIERSEFARRSINGTSEILCMADATMGKIDLSMAIIYDGEGFIYNVALYDKDKRFIEGYNIIVDWYGNITSSKEIDEKLYDTLTQSVMFGMEEGVKI